VKIEVRELRKITDLLLEHVESLGVTQVNLEDDYYWTIPTDQRYDPSRTSVTPDLGQLTDDWHELQMILRGERPAVALALGWLGAVMTSVGENVSG